MAINPEKFKALLLARRMELRRDNRQTTESSSAVKLDQQSVGRVSRIDAMQRQAMAQAGEQRRIMEINRIGSALSRIDVGEYGYCLKCGDDIAVKRLEFDPAVALCIDCAKG